MRSETRFIVLHRGEVELQEYHVTVNRDGSIVYNRDLDAKDQCCRNFNSVSLSVVVVGAFCSSYPKARYATPSAEQLAVLPALLARLLTKYPAAKLSGHSELGTGGTYDVNKLKPENSCPGDRFPLAEVKKQTADLLARQGEATRELQRP